MWSYEGQRSHAKRNVQTYNTIYCSYCDYCDVVFVCAEEKPDMYYLEHFKVIQKVATDWKKVSHLLKLPRFVVDNIQHDTVIFGCERSCREAFSQWLGGEGCQPSTWERLIEVLKDAERSELAKELKQYFTS